MTAPITPDERAAMRTLADAATPGPWEAHEGTVGAMTGPRGCGGCSGLVSPRHEPACFWSEVAGAAPADAAFIAAARMAVPRLLDALDTAETTAKGAVALYAHETERAERAEAEVERLRAATSPAWDEDTVYEAVARAVFGAFQRDVDRGVFPHTAVAVLSRTAAHEVLAVVRDHLPVRPDREALIEAMSAALHITTDRIPGLNPGPALSADTTSVEVAADAALAEWPGESRAQVEAAALRAAADEAEATDADALVAGCAAPVSGERGRQSVIDAARAMCEEPWTWLRARADRLTGEGGQQ